MTVRRCRAWRCRDRKSAYAAPQGFGAGWHRPGDVLLARPSRRTRGACSPTTLYHPTRPAPPPPSGQASVVLNGFGDAAPAVASVTAAAAGAGAGGRVAFVSADLMTEAGNAALAAGAHKALGHVDIVVNNAGMATPYGSLFAMQWAWALGKCCATARARRAACCALCCRHAARRVGAGV